MTGTFHAPGRSRWVRTAATVAALALTVTALGACTTDGGTGNEGTSDDGGLADFSPVTLRFAHYLGPTTPQAESVAAWAEEVNELTDGKVTVEFSYSSSLLAATDILPGVADGRADLGWTGSIYHPQEIGLSEMAAIPFLADNPQVQMDAYADLYSQGGILAQEYEEAGVHVLLWPFLGEVVLGSNDAIENVADLQGVSVRAAGGVAQSLAAAGANPVALTAGEIYEGLQRGTIGAYSSLAFEQIGAFSLPEVATNTTITGIGLYTQAVVIIGTDTWESFPEAVKDAFNTANANFQDYAVPDFLAAGEDATCQAIKDVDGELILWSDSEVNRFKNLVGDGPKEAWIENSANKFPREEVEALYDEYVELLDKYAAETDIQPGAQRCAATF